jgi:hypothetical protein
LIQSRVFKPVRLNDDTFLLQIAKKDPKLLACRRSVRIGHAANQYVAGICAVQPCEGRDQISSDLQNYPRACCQEYEMDFVFPANVYVDTVP